MRMVSKVSRLYEQGADNRRIEAYFQRWWQWLRSGVQALEVWVFNRISSSVNLHDFFPLWKAFAVDFGAFRCR